MVFLGQEWALSVRPSLCQVSVFFCVGGVVTKDNTERATTAYVPGGMPLLYFIFCACVMCRVLLQSGSVAFFIFPHE